MKYDPYIGLEMKNGNKFTDIRSNSCVLDSIARCEPILRSIVLNGFKRQLDLHGMTEKNILNRIIQCQIQYLVSLADLWGSLGMYASPSLHPAVEFLSFSCSFRHKSCSNNRVFVPIPAIISPSRLGNPGSATGFCMVRGGSRIPRRRGRQSSWRGC